MDNLIKKYVYNVIKHLPKDIRQEVAIDLEASIYEMIGNNESLEKTEAVLISLGDPKILSDQYLDNSKVLIPSYLYSEYILTLKMTILIVSILTFSFITFYMLQQDIKTTIVNHINKIIILNIMLIILTVIISYALVTLIFQIKALKDKKVKSKWQLKDLQQLPKEGAYKISNKKVLTELSVYTIIWALVSYIFIFYKQIKIFNVKIEFNENVTVIFIPLFIICLIFLIVKSVIKLKQTHINLTTTILDTITYVYTIIISAVFILHTDLITKSSFELINKNTYLIFTITLTSLIGLIELSKISLIWYKYLHKN